MNTDLRTATVMNYFTCDFAFGLGIPLANKYRGEDVIIAVEKLYWHAGTTILLGNNYTNSLFVQAGIYNASFTKQKDNSVVAPEDIYLLIEPRLLFKNTHLNLSIYSLPPDTVKKLLLLEDTLGMNLNFYSEASLNGSNTLTYGSHLNLSVIDKNFMDLKDFSNISENGYNLNLTPYITSSFLSGELHLQATFRLMEFVRAVSVDLGYRTKF